MESKSKILIIDDNPQNIQLLATILTEHNFDVEIGQSGQEALDTLQDEAFDLLLLDVMMPQMNGYQVCQQIRKNTQYNNMPIIFISAKNDEQSIVDGFKSGGQDYINKPFKEEELLARINTHISLKKNQEELSRINSSQEEMIQLRTRELFAAYEKVKIAERQKKQFFSFIGTEISNLMGQMEEHIYAIRLSAESTHLSGLINDCSTSYSKLKKMTSLAGKVARIDSEHDSSRQVDLDMLALIEVVLSKLDDKIAEKELNLELKLPEILRVKTIYDLFKDSFSIFIESILANVRVGSNITMYAEDAEDRIRLFLECELSQARSSELSEELHLYISFFDLIMNFTHGAFNVRNSNQCTIYNWDFKKQKQ